MRMRNEVSFRYAPVSLAARGRRPENKADSTTGACMAFDMPSERERDDALFERGVGIMMAAVWALCCVCEALA